MATKAAIYGANLSFDRDMVLESEMRTETMRKWKLHPPFLFLIFLVPLILITGYLMYLGQNVPIGTRMFLPGYDFAVIQYENIQTNQEVSATFQCKNGEYKTVHVNPEIDSRGVKFLGMNVWFKHENAPIQVQVCGLLKQIGKLKSIDLKANTVDIYLYSLPQHPNFRPR